MRTVNELLDQAKAAQGIDTDMALAKALGVGRAAVSTWRHGTRLPDTIACATIAGLAGLPLAKVLGIVGEARAISREEKAVWRKLAATAMMLLFVVAPSLNPAAAYTRTAEMNRHNLYVLCEVARRIAAAVIGLVVGSRRGRAATALLA